MKPKTILWAQALDNTSPDHIRVDGEDLRENDMKRQEAVSFVSNFPNSGSHYENNGFSLTINRQEYKIQVLSIERDSSGRLAPIIFWGNIQKDALKDTGEIKINIENFARKINRNIQKDHLNFIDYSFAQKNQKKNKKILAAIIILLILGSGVYVISSAKNHPSSNSIEKQNDSFFPN